MKIVDFKSKLDERNGIALDENYILFNDYELYNQSTEQSINYKSFDDVLNYKINGKTISEIIEEKDDVNELEYGGRGSSSSSRSKGSLFDGKGSRKAGKGTGEAQKPLPPAYINTLTSSRYKSVEGTAKAFGKNFLNADREYAGLIDDKGFAVQYTKGNKTSVQHLERKGAYSIHNHPTKFLNKKGNAYSNAPSGQDLRNWALGQGKGTIVVASQTRTMYLMEKGNKFKAKDFVKGMKSAKSTGKYDNDVNNWLRKNAKTYGYKYTKSKF